MKAKVVQRFKDKHTGEMHEVDDIITISKKRFAEILEVAPLVEEIKEETKAE